MARKRYAVTPQGKDWVVQTGGQNVRRFGTKEPAIEEAVRRAKGFDGDAQVVIHRSDGTIENERTFGHDPFPPKG